jgi:YfiH family protein
MITVRHPGASAAPFDGFNLAAHVGDHTATVQANRDRLTSAAGVDIAWLNQVHGTRVVTATPHALLNADASISVTPGLACAVLTADCLPVLLCNHKATEVAAVHCGWKGLVNGILAATVASMSCEASTLSAYLGPGIGPQAYEVGLEVVEAVFASATTAQEATALGRAVHPGRRALHFHLDLYEVARVQLQTLGIHDVHGGDFCTYSDPRFYSYRRQATTGRHCSLIWIKP